jgi:HPr kinase/phosphorylase
MSDSILMHATTVAINRMGIIILGPPGSGKSDLTLRLIDQPGFGTGHEVLAARLVADDQTFIRKTRGMLIASAPAALKGLLEIRGQGIVAVGTEDSATLCLAIVLKPEAEIGRMPDAPYTDILGVRLPRADIDPSRASAPARVRAALLGLAFQ